MKKLLQQSGSQDAVDNSSYVSSESFQECSDNVDIMCASSSSFPSDTSSYSSSSSSGCVRRNYPANLLERKQSQAQAPKETMDRPPQPNKETVRGNGS